MAKTKNPTLEQDLKDDIEALSKCKGWYESLKVDRYIIERDNFYRPQRAYRGQLFDQWNKYDRTITTPAPKRGEVRLPVPILKTIIDLNALELTKDDPNFEVMPSSTSDEDMKEAKWNQMLLDALYEKGRLKEKFRKDAKSGLLTSVGIMEVYYNPEYNNGEGKAKGEVEYNVIRPEDFYISLSQEDVATAPIVAKVFTKDLDAIKNSTLYDAKKSEWLDDLVPDNENTDSDVSKQIQNETYGTESKKDSNHGTVLLVECYLRYYPAGETSPKYRIVTFSAKQGLLLRNEETDLDRPPFFVFHTDQNLGEFYGQGKAAPVIPMVKALSNMQSRLQEHLLRYTRASMMVPRGAQLFRTTNESGEIWLHNAGRAPQMNPVPALPREVLEQLNLLEKYIQDSAGTHDVSMGRTPQGIESARAIENLIHGDQQAKGDLKDNFATFISDIGKYSLKLISKHYTKPRLISIYTDSGDMTQFHAVGQSGSPQTKRDFSNPETNAVVIKPENDVRVTVGSAMAYTPEARQQKAMSLLERGLISRTTALKPFAIGNATEEAQAGLEDAMQAQAIQKQGPPPPPTTLKDILQFHADTFFTPNEKVQLKQKLFQIQPDPPEQQNPADLQAANQMQLENHKAELARGNAEHQAVIDIHKRLAETHLNSIDNAITTPVGPDASGLGSAAQSGA